MQQVKKDIFSRLKRLFSTDVIIQQTGRNQVKTTDINRVQQNSPLTNNYASGKYSPVYQGMNSMMGNFGGGLGGMQQGMLRQQLYAEYEAMDNDAIISSALDVVASLATLENNEGKILKITSSDGEIKAYLENLFYDILNVDFNIWTWMRDMIKYGDTFLFLKIVDELGIVGVTPMSSYICEIIQDPITGELTYSYDMLGGQNVSFGKEGMYKNYEIAHFKLNSATNYFPYSRSFIEGARKSWQMLTLMEDASLSHRLIRSADKRQFFIDVASISPDQVPTFMQNFANNIKRTPLIDPLTGQYNLKYNIENIMEDFYFPVRGTQTGTRIENLAGLTFAGMEDVEYHKQKVFNALKIPKAFLSETSDLNGTSTLANMTVAFGQSIERVQKAFVAEFYKIAITHLYTKGIGADNNLLNFELSLTSPSIIYEQERIATMKEKVNLAQQLLDINMFSTDYIYKTVFNVSEDEFDELRDELLEDKKRTFRISQIENEGNDPLESGKSYGTPSDLAGMYNNKVHVEPSDKIEAVTQDIANPEGRPETHSSIIGTDDSNLSRDPVFKHRKMATNYQNNLNPSDNRIQENDKINIYNKTNILEQLKKSFLFNEKTIIE